MNQNVSLLDMNRRSFFGFFPAAVAGVVLGVPAVKSAWGEGIPALLNAWSRAVKSYAEVSGTMPVRGFFKGRKLTAAERDEFARMYIHSRKVLNESPELRKYVDGQLHMSTETIKRLTIRASDEGMQQTRIDLQRLRRTQELLSNYPTT